MDNSHGPNCGCSFCSALGRLKDLVCRPERDPRLILLASDRVRFLYSELLDYKEGIAQPREYAGCFPLRDLALPPGGYPVQPKAASWIASTSDSTKTSSPATAPKSSGLQPGTLLPPPPQHFWSAPGVGHSTGSAPSPWDIPPPPPPVGDRTREEPPVPDREHKDRKDKDKKDSKKERKAKERKEETETRKERKRHRSPPSPAKSTPRKRRKEPSSSPEVKARSSGRARIPVKVEPQSDEEDKDPPEEEADWDEEDIKEEEPHPEERTKEERRGPRPPDYPPGLKPQWQGPIPPPGFRGDRDFGGGRGVQKKERNQRFLEERLWNRGDPSPSRSRRERRRR